MAQIGGLKTDVGQMKILVEIVSLLTILEPQSNLTKFLCPKPGI